MSALRRDPAKWTRKSILNTARMGKFAQTALSATTAPSLENEAGCASMIAARSFGDVIERGKPFPLGANVRDGGLRR